MKIFAVLPTSLMLFFKLFELVSFSPGKAKSDCFVWSWFRSFWNNCQDLAKFVDWNTKYTIPIPSVCWERPNETRWLQRWGMSQVCRWAAQSLTRTRFAGWASASKSWSATTFQHKSPMAEHFLFASQLFPCNLSYQQRRRRWENSQIIP